MLCIIIECEVNITFILSSCHPKKGLSSLREKCRLLKINFKTNLSLFGRLNLVFWEAFNISDSTLIYHASIWQQIVLG